MNDTPPTFASYSTIKFSEDTLPGEVVATLSASDADLESKIKYSLVSGATGTFTIDENTGDLSILHTVDREELETYRLGIRASDGEHNTVINTIIIVSIYD